MTERADNLWYQYQDQAVTVHEPLVIASTLWIGRDAVDQAWTSLNCMDMIQLADVLIQFLFAAQKDLFNVVCRLSF